MTTNLMIARAHIPFEGTALAAPTAASGYEAQAIGSGPRAQGFKSSASISSATWDYDLGSGVTAQPDHLIVCRANQLARHGTVTWTTTGSASAAFTSPNTKTGTFTTSSLLGPRSEDFVTTFTYSSAYRYWRITLSTSTSFVYEVSKIFFGAFLDLGREPLLEAPIARDVLRQKNREPAYSSRFVWDGLTATARQNFMTYVYKLRGIAPIALYDTADVLFQSHRVLHCDVSDGEFTPLNAIRHKIGADIRELI